MQMTATSGTMEKIYTLILKGIECWIEAGKIVAEQIDKDEDFVEKLNRAHPEISTEMIYAFEMVGRKQLSPRLLVCDGPGPKRLRKLPLQLQERYLDNPVPMLIKTEKGWETLKADVRTLTLSQAAQVFGECGVRSEAAQRAWIESKSALRAPIEVNEPYRVVGRSLVIVEPCKLTAKQVAQILAQME
jgi:hypothetical protein